MEVAEKLEVGVVIARRLSSLLCLLVLLPAVARADEVRFGERSVLEGEVKYMERGRLYFKTSATDTIHVEWEEVRALASSELLEVELESGALYYGSLVPSDSEGSLQLQRASDTVDIPIAQVIRMTTLEEDFLARFSGTLSAGLYMTKVNQYRQVNLGLSLDYATRRYESSLNLDSLITDSTEYDSSEQAKLTINTRRKLANRWHTGGFIAFERNEELGVQLRSSIGSVIGRSLIQTNTRRFIMEGGLIFGREQEVDSGDSADSIDSLARMEYQLFLPSDPDIDLTSGISVIPSLSDWGRVRANLDVTLRWEIINALSWTLTFRDSYDNHPPADAATNDYSLITGVAWDL
ncbi:MAG: DUF481 domain-containing protein [Pseudomonadales bacterium]